MIKDFKSFVFVSVDVKGVADAKFVSVDVKRLSEKRRLEATLESKKSRLREGMGVPWEGWSNPGLGVSAERVGRQKLLSKR